MEIISEVEILNPKDKDLDQLTEELIQVFSFNSINCNTNSQKEALIQRILKLGGKYYTNEDLIRDLLKIEMEDDLLRKTQKCGSAIVSNQEANRVGKSIMEEIKIPKEE